MAAPSYNVDISTIINSLNYMDQIPAKVLESIADEVRDAVRGTLINVFQQAMGTQNPYAFPEEYKEHVLRVVAEAPIHSGISGNSFFVDFDFDVLGNEQDLRRAFHQGAALVGGGFVDGPYDESMELKNSTEERHLFWESVRRGDSAGPASGKQIRRKSGRYGKKGKGVPIAPGAWEETKAKYIEIWGDKAPEWLYLQFGQTLWEPYIKPAAVIEDFSSQFYAIAEDIWYNRLAAEVAIANSTNLSHHPGYYTTYPTIGRKYNYRDTLGRFALLK